MNKDDQIKGMSQLNRGSVGFQEALAKQEQVEPVAWMHKQGNHEEPSFRQLDDWEISNGWTQKPLYTTPQPAQKPLTDEQIAPMFAKRQSQETIGEKDAWYFYAWGVNDGEAAHGIRSRNE